MKKSIVFSFLFTICYLLFATNVSAALVTIDSEGKVVWQVLGDSTIEVKSVAQNLASNNTQISLNNTNGKIELNNIDVTNLQGDLVEILARGDTNNLKIGSLENKFTIEENGITAETLFPIIIDPTKNELLVTTNSGSRLISILPYEATLLLIRGKFIDTVNSNKINLAEGSNGELQYLISGRRQINLFNITEISADVTSTVSASSGKIMKIDEPQWLKFFGFLFS